LGNGYSISQLTSKEWEIVKASDSVGVNGSIYHPFVPDFYMYEPAVTHRQHLFFLDVLKRREDEYAKVPLVIHFPHAIERKRDFSSLYNRPLTYFNVPIQVNTPSKVLLTKALNWFLSSKNEKSLQMHHAASLSYITMAGALMGFRKIVYLGVDLNDSRYYFHADNATSLEREYVDIHDEIEREIRKRSKNSLHPTADKSSTAKYGCLTIIDFLDFLNSRLKDRGIELYTGNPNSKLVEIMPVFKLGSDEARA
jgi:hypothetical protein